MPLPRRKSCLTRRALLAVLRDAEFHDWLNTGDDSPGQMLMPVH